MLGSGSPVTKSKAAEPADQIGGDNLLFENDLAAAVEVKFGQQMKVLYPHRSHRFMVSDGEMIEVCLRDDPTISGTCRFIQGASVLCASDSFGSFGIEAAEFLQTDWREVEREQGLLRDRRRSVDVSFKTQRRRYGAYLFPLCFSCLILIFGLLVLCAFVEPKNEAVAMLLCLALVVLLAGLAWCIALTGFSAVRLPRGRRRLVYHSSHVFFFLGSACVVTALAHSIMEGFLLVAVAAGLPCCGIFAFVFYQWCTLPFNAKLKSWETYQQKVLVERTIVFYGKVLPGKVPCVCSWPGKYESAWEGLVASSDAGAISVAVVFLPQGPKHFGQHDKIPKAEGLEGSCWCTALYGEPKPWGCRAWSHWMENVETAFRNGAELQVYFFKGMKGKGKVQDFTMAGQTYLRRQAIQEKKELFLESNAYSAACDDGIEELSRLPRGDSSSHYSREVQRLFLAWLPAEERNFMEAGDGLGNSQKAEVAWLERKGYPYTEMEVDVFQWLQ